MTTGRRASQIANDRAVAGVLGAILMLALAVTAYAHAVHTNIPRWGAEAERAWSDAASAGMLELAHGMGGDAGDPFATSVTIPPPPEPQALDIPLLGRTVPLLPTGSLTYERACASISASHSRHSGTLVPNLKDVPLGCMRFDAATTYTEAFAYHVEAGGVLRVQDGRAVVVKGPYFEVTKVNAQTYQVGLAFSDLRGTPTTSAIERVGAQVDLVPVTARSETRAPATPNAASAQWALDTAYPAAWRQWFEASLSKAQFVASRAAPGPGETPSDYRVECDRSDCSVGASGRGRVTVTIHGPRSDVEDLRFYFAYDVLDVTVR